MSNASGPRIAIRYCTQCHWLLRAAWMARTAFDVSGPIWGKCHCNPEPGGVL